MLSGLGTFAASMASGTVNIDFTPNAGIACTVNTVRVSLASTESVGTGHSIISVGSENIARMSPSTLHFPQVQLLVFIPLQLTLVVVMMITSSLLYRKY